MTFLEHDRYPYKPDDEYLKRLSIEVDNNVSDVINNYLLQTNGLALEIGGPTKTGFSVLEGVTFPNKLVISNVFPDDDSVADIDVTDLPFNDNSLGCIIASRLPISFPDIDGFKEKPGLVLNNLDILAYDFKLGQYNKIRDERIVKSSPRIALAREARRTLECGGLLITKHLLENEIKIIEDLGFSMVYHIESFSGQQRDRWHRGEYVFRLDDMDKIAGRIAVSGYFNHESD